MPGTDQIFSRRDVWNAKFAIGIGSRIKHVRNHENRAGHILVNRTKILQRTFLIKHHGFALALRVNAQIEFFDFRKGIHIVGDGIVIREIDGLSCDGDSKVWIELSVVLRDDDMTGRLRKACG